MNNEHKNDELVSAYDRLRLQERVHKWFFYLSCLVWPLSVFMIITINNSTFHASLASIGTFPLLLSSRKKVERTKSKIVLYSQFFSTDLEGVENV